MNAEPQKAGDSGVAVPIPAELQEAVARAQRVLAFCRDSVFSLPPPSEDCCWHAGMALLHVMHDQLEAARLYTKESPQRPFPVMVLVRPIYEAMLQLLYLLRPEKPEDRQTLGWKFLAFQAVDELAGIEKVSGGLNTYKKQLTEKKAPRFCRIREIADQAEARFTPQQKQQQERFKKRGRWNVTWTGYSSLKLAQELGEELHKFYVPWYGVLSMASHVSPGMVPWSYSLFGNDTEATEYVVRCMIQSTDWLNRGSTIVFCCCQKFLRTYDIAPSDTETRLDELVQTIHKVSKAQTEDEEALRGDLVIRDLVERIVQVAQPRRIILFGSAARGDNRPNSDLDVLVIMPEGADLSRAEVDMYRSMRGLGMPVDIVAVTEDQVRQYGDNPNLVIHTATTEGKEIYRAAG